MALFTNLLSSRHLTIRCCFKLTSRALSSTPALSVKYCRVERGLPVNKNAEGILTDGPDYSFLDGRPTPLLNKQKMRMLKQRDFATKIVELSNELDYAIDRERSIKEAKEQERQNVINNRLKPKGLALFKKK